MTDAALRVGGPWYCDYGQVCADGYLEDFGYQEATLNVGPTCDGVPRSGSSQPPGAGGGGGHATSFRSRAQQMPRTGEKVRDDA